MKACTQDHDTVTPIQRLRRLRRALEAGQALEPADAAWLATGMASYLAAAGAATLDRALGLAPERGEAGWWTTEPREARDEAIIRLADQLFGQLEISRAADEIVALFNRGRQRGPLAENERVLIAGVKRTDRGLPGRKQLVNILRRAKKSDAASNFPA